MSDVDIVGELEDAERKIEELRRISNSIKHKAQYLTHAIFKKILEDGYVILTRSYLYDEILGIGDWWGHYNAVIKHLVKNGVLVKNGTKLEPTDRELIEFYVKHPQATYMAIHRQERGYKSSYESMKAKL